MTEISPGFLCLNINGLMNIVFFFLSGRDTGQIGCTAGLCQGDALAGITFGKTLRLLILKI